MSVEEGWRWEGVGLGEFERAVGRRLGIGF